MSDHETYARYYATWYAAGPDRTRQILAHYARELGPHLPASRDLRCLDVGCGTGNLLRYLLAEGFRSVEGLEVNPAQAANAGDLRPRIAVSDDTAAWLEARPGAYDLIVSTDVLEHVPRGERVRFTSALRGALAPGGLLLCTTPNANAGLGMRWRYIDDTHHTSFTEHSLTFLLRAAGFDDVRIAPSEIFRQPDVRGAWIKGPAAALLRRAVRAARRLEYVAELGVEEGFGVPLTVNLLARARAAVKMCGSMSDRGSASRCEPGKDDR